MTAIAVFLVLKAVPAIRADQVGFFTSKAWNPVGGNARFGILVIAFGTVVSSALALVMGCRSRWVWRCSSRITRRAAWPLFSATSPISWPRCQASCSACGAGTSRGLGYKFEV